MNWYTRRIVLAGIYKTTELYMLQDNSEDHRKTWNFLERRIKDATQVHTILTTTSDMALPDLNRATETASAVFVTVSFLKFELLSKIFKPYISISNRHAIYSD